MSLATSLGTEIVNIPPPVLELFISDLRLHKGMK